MSVWIIIGAALWLSVVVVAIAMCVASARADRAMQDEGTSPWRVRERDERWRAEGRPAGNPPERIEPTGRFVRRRDRLRPLRPR